MNDIPPRRIGYDPPRPSHDELLAELRTHITPGGTRTAERVASDLTTTTDPVVDELMVLVGCLYESPAGTGRCDGTYHHQGDVHYRVARHEVWVDPA